MSHEFSVYERKYDGFLCLKVFHLYLSDSLLWVSLERDSKLLCGVFISGWMRRLNCSVAANSWNLGVQCHLHKIFSPTSMRNSKLNDFGTPLTSGSLSYRWGFIKFNLHFILMSYKSTPLLYSCSLRCIFSNNLRMWWKVWTLSPEKCTKVQMCMHTHTCHFLNNFGRFMDPLKPFHGSQVMNPTKN